MVFNLKRIKVKIKYPFLLILSFSALLNANEILYVLLFSLLHEAGHIAALYLLGGKADEIIFSFYGIGLKHSSVLKKSSEMIFLLGGVTVNLIFVLLRIKTEINLALLILNILPLYPLDGGRILKLLFGIREKHFKILTYFFCAVLFGISIYYRNIYLILICIYIFLFSLNEDFK